MHKNQAFTMIEMVVAVVIVGVLLGIGIPSYFRSAEIAKCKEAMSTLNAMASSAFAFYAENDTFAGLSVAAINIQSGVSVVNNADWTYLVTSATSSGFTLTSTRLRGPHQAAGNTTIILDQDYNWTGTYPHADPGNF
ncbi:MAG: prepilin-type N-terminal cleavage/methylation domain-containing protein [Candidatus Omnitrophota bacterium]